MKLSVVIPVYNEDRTISEILKKVMEVDIEKEIIIVDDCSTDGTREILKTVNQLTDLPVTSQNQIKIVYHDKNKGKGAAIRTGLKEVTGDIVIIQDADLEYNPQDYYILMQPILDRKADVVYGSRFLKLKHITLFWHYIANKILNLLTNLLYGTCLTDMETCYKMFNINVIRGIDIKSDRFDFEPEITAKILRKGYKICEISISYKFRGYSEGKKIGWKDGFAAFWTLIKYRFFD